MMRAVAAAALLLVCRCGGDAPTDPIRVAVPAHDDTPPEAVITMRSTEGRRLARASQPPEPAHPRPVSLREPRLQGIALGRDPNGGIARVRVSISERIACRREGARTEEVLRTRYIPPPQIETIRSNPGARLPRTLTRTVPLALAGHRCGAADPAAVHGELWGEAINGAGLEAVTPHLRFRWQRIPPNP
jgi:hypothetical protein